MSDNPTTPRVATDGRRTVGRSLLTLAVALAAVGALVFHGLRDGGRDQTPRDWTSARGVVSSLAEFEPFPDATWTCELGSLSSDGRQILSTYRHEPFLRLWNTTGGAIPTFGPHDESISCLAGDERRRLALSGSYDRSLILWSFDDGKPRRRLVGHTQYVAGVAFVDDGKRAISGAGDGVVLLWNLEREEPAMAMPSVSKAAVTCVAARRNVAAVGRDDGAIEVWSVDGNDPPRSIAAHDGPVECLTFLDDGSLLVSGGRDRRLLAWKPADGSRVREFAEHDNWVTCAAASPDGQWLASASDDLTLRVWNTQTGALVDRIDFGRHGMSVVALRFVLDRELAVLTSHRIVLRLGLR